MRIQLCRCVWVRGRQDHLKVTLPFSPPPIVDSLRTIDDGTILLYPHVGILITIDANTVQLYPHVDSLRPIDESTFPLYPVIDSLRTIDASTLPPYFHVNSRHRLFEDNSIPLLSAWDQMMTAQCTLLPSYQSETNWWEHSLTIPHVASLRPIDDLLPVWDYPLMTCCQYERHWWHVASLTPSDDILCQSETHWRHVATILTPSDDM